MTKNLGHLGWESYVSALGSPPASAARLGRVRRVDRGEVDVVTADGDVRAASDSMRSQSEHAPATGDWVELEDDPDVGVRIVRVLPRATALVRRDPAEEELEQVLVANADFVGVTAGVDRPLNVARIERFLVVASDSGAEPLLVLTKADIDHGEEWNDLAEDLGGVTVVATSARTGQGIDRLQAMVSDARTLALLGESGSGKSTLVNRLVGAEVQETGSVRAGDAKGRHTTTARQLVQIARGGLLIDTPGVRGVGLWDARGALERVFGDVSALADQCRFGDCRHDSEPSCAVLAAVADGSLNASRLVRYVRLRDELDEQDRRREQQRRKPTGKPR